jgi:hypothetical protein
VVEDLRHQIPRWSGIETEAVFLPQARSAAQPRVSFNQGDLVTIPREKASGSYAADSTTNDDNGLRHVEPF